MQPLVEEEQEEQEGWQELVEEEEGWQVLVEEEEGICHQSFFRYAARGDRTRTAPLRRYATNLHAMLHSLVINRA